MSLFQMHLQKVWYLTDFHSPKNVLPRKEGKANMQEVNYQQS